MNSAYLHLILNHIPVIASFLGFLILLIGMLKKSRDIKNTGLFVLLLAALATIPTYFSGENAPEVVSGLPEVTDAFIHAHEEWAEKVFLAALAMGGLSLLGLGLTFRPQGTPVWVYGIVLLLSLGVSGAMAYTANLGGKIRHTEVRPGFKPPPPGPSGSGHHH